MPERSSSGSPETPRFRTYADDEWLERQEERPAARYDPDAGRFGRRRFQDHPGHIARRVQPRVSERPSRLRPLLLALLIFCIAAAAGFLVPRSLFDPGARRTATAEVATARPAVVPSPDPAPSAVVETAAPAGLQVEVVGREPAAVPASPTPSPRPAQPAHRATLSAPIARPAAALPPRAAGNGPVRVFIHVASPDQRQGAERLRARIGGLRFAGAPVGAPAVRVTGKAPRRTELRCLKQADCPAANLIARRLTTWLGTPVPVVDMSATYEGDAAVRRGSLELWLRS